MKVSPEDAIGEGEGEEAVGEGEDMSPIGSPEKEKEDAASVESENKETKMDFFEMHNPNLGFESVGDIIGLRYANKSEADLMSQDETYDKSKEDKLAPVRMDTDESV